MTWQRFALTRESCNPFPNTTDGSTGKAEEAVVEVEPSGESNADRTDHLDKSVQLNESVTPKQPIADPAPPWRQFMDWDEFNKPDETNNSCAEAAWKRWQKLIKIEKSSPNPRAVERAESFVLPETDPCRELVLAVNAALALRRPLLVTGLPGSGKTTLAYAVAAWLELGPVLEWAVSPGANLADALATYDPMARLQDLEISKQNNPAPRPVEDYIRLGPVGTAFLPAHLPRVLLIDEIDKGDLNLANELLNLFEEGRFPIPELQRTETAAGNQSQLSGERKLATFDEDAAGKPIPAFIKGGVVQCHEFPLVVMSSNGERDFPPAFNRRCLRISMPDFSHDLTTLELIVRRHLVKKKQEQQDQLQQVKTALTSFTRAAEKARGRNDNLAMDQLLNFAFLLETSAKVEGNVRSNVNSIIESLEKVLLQSLNTDTEVSTDQ
jgi:MoxR-like ATPase